MRVSGELRAVTAAPLPYLLSLPAPAAGGTARPVLCFLHGYDEAAPLDLRVGVTRHGPLRRESWAGARELFVVVAPQLPTAGDHWHRHADAVLRIVREARDAHGGDATRFYLTGFSFGGNGALDLAVLQPDVWAAVWAVDPTRAPTRPVARPVWLSVGEIARRRLAGFRHVLDLRAAGPSAETGDRVYLDEEADHVGSATLAYADPRVYEWLLARCLPASGGPE